MILVALLQNPWNVKPVIPLLSTRGRNIIKMRIWELVCFPQTVEPVDQLLQCVDPAKDRELWVRDNKTGEIRPVDMEIWAWHFRSTNHLLQFGICLIFLWLLREWGMIGKPIPTQVEGDCLWGVNLSYEWWCQVSVCVAWHHTEVLLGIANDQEATR